MASIQDPSNGNAASVLEDGRLTVDSKSSPLQHIVSSEEQQAYQVQGSVVLINGTTTALHIKNISTTRNMVITFIRMQLVAPVAVVPELATYVTINRNTTIAGGALVIPENMYLGHSNAAEVVANSGTTPITIGGVAAEFDRWYPASDGDRNTFNKEGVVLIPPQEAINLSMVSGTAGGELHTRISFIMEVA